MCDNAWAIAFAKSSICGDKHAQDVSRATRELFYAKNPLQKKQPNT